TILFLIALGLMGLSLAVGPGWLKLIVPVVLVCNYTPPFIAHQLLRRSSLDLSLSSSMSERLGLFTIIVFGEVVLGVVNGMSRVPSPGFSGWLNFALAVSIVFALWWIFFSLLSDRKAKKGFVRASFLELLCLPTLMSLGLIAACYSWLFKPGDEVRSLHIVFGFALATFLAGVSLIMGLLVYPKIVHPIIRPVRISLFVTALVFLVGSMIKLNLETKYFLIAVIIILIAEIFYLNSLYYRLNIEEGTKMDNE
ncbi:MAG TPA: low temperature requirement protein A, partial [Chitinophagaceae bacterium]|nr:low temperature requirement protein A [Chitinophagaceae bacterium]